MRLPIFLLALIVLLLEAAVYMLIGEAIGVAPVVALTAASTICGILLLRKQGKGALARLRDGDRLRAEALADGVLLAVAALLMIVPGLLTSAGGLLLFIPSNRARLLRRLRNALVSRQREPGEGGVVDLRPDEYAHARTGSPWRRSG